MHQLGPGSTINDGSRPYLIDKLSGISTELGFTEYTSGTTSTLDIFARSLTLMIGIAGIHT